MGLAWTLVLNGMLGLAGYWTARYGARQPAGLARGLAAATLAWAWATLGMEVLGSAGWLARGPLLLWTGLALGAGLALRATRSESGDYESAPKGGGRWDALSLV